MLPEENQYIILSLGQIKQSGYLNPKIENPKNNNCFSNSSLLKILKKNNQYTYNIELLEEVKCNAIEDVPTIKITGKVVKYLETGDIYVEEGALATSYSGEDLTDNIITTVTGSGSTIDTTEEGAYQITYSITHNNKTMIAVRNVFVTI